MMETGAWKNTNWYEKRTKQLHEEMQNIDGSSGFAGGLYSRKYC